MNYTYLYMILEVCRSHRDGQTSEAVTPMRGGVRDGLLRSQQPAVPGLLPRAVLRPPAALLLRSA